MTLTQPLSGMGLAFDDIIFGEPSLAFGVLLLATSLLLWRKANLYISQGVNMKKTPDISRLLKEELPYLLKPMSYFGAAMGLGLMFIALAGMYYQLFAAPPEEPISGLLADYPMIEATFISGLYAITGLGAILFPFALKEKPNPSIISIIKQRWIIAGILFLVFGALNYFTHVGLIVNTME